MRSIVEDARREWLVNQDQEKRRNRVERPEPKLYPSELNGCHRKTALRLLGYKPTIDFEAKSLEYMRGGVISEDDTALSLETNIEGCQQNFQLLTEHWSGYADFIINHGLDGDVTIIEHKQTGERHWQEETLPKRDHVGQLVLYYYLYQQLYNKEPKIRLYYKGWGHYAEFQLFIRDKHVVCIGMVDDIPTAVKIKYNVLKEKTQLELLRERILAGDETLPPKLKYKNMGCSYNGRPNCPFYHHCYPK